GVTTVTWTATDLHGNIKTATQTVTVIDNQNPTITCPANVTVNTDQGQCSASSANVNLGTPVTADNCAVVSVTNNHPATYPIGVTVVTWTVTDPAGHTATCNQTVTVEDNQGPALTCGNAIPVNNLPGLCN